MRTIGKMVSGARKEKGWTQQELALRLGLAKETIRSWEKGKREPTLLNAVRLASVLAPHLELGKLLDAMKKKRAKEIKASPLQLLILREIVTHQPTGHRVAERKGISQATFTHLLYTLESPSFKTLLLLHEKFGLSMEILINTAHQEGKLTERKTELPEEIEAFRQKAGLSTLPAWILTQREWEILRLRHQGRSLQKIAQLIAQEEDLGQVLTRERIRQILGHIQKTLLECPYEINLGRLIRTIRLSYHWSQKKTAGKIGISRQSLCFIEKGKRLPGLLVAARIAYILGLDLKTFLTRWLNERKQRKDKEKTILTQTSLLLLASISEAGYLSPKKLAQDFGYPFRTLQNWLQGTIIPSSSSQEKLSRDLKIPLKKLREAASQDKALFQRSPASFGKPLGSRKRPSYPNRIAALVHRARVAKNLSSVDLGRLEFPEKTIWQLETQGRATYGLASSKKRLFELARLLEIPRAVILAAYLNDNIERDTKKLNLKRYPFATAKLITWLRLLLGLTLPELSRRTGIPCYIIQMHLSGKRLLTYEELNQVIKFFALEEKDLEIIYLAWERDKKFFQRNRKPRS